MRGDKMKLSGLPANAWTHVVEYAGKIREDVGETSAHMKQVTFIIKRKRCNQIMEKAAAPALGDPPDRQATTVGGLIWRSGIRLSGHEIHEHKWKFKNTSDSANLAAASAFAMEPAIPCTVAAQLDAPKKHSLDFQKVQ